MADVLNTNNQRITNYDDAKVFKTNFKAITGTYTNGTGGDITISAGMLFGRVTADLKLAILASAAVDGSQIPLGIVPDEVYHVVADGASITLTLGVTGMVDEDLIVLDGTDTLDTVVDGRPLRDLIPAATEGITIESFNQLTKYDNQ